jgi:hypothetical protein
MASRLELHEELREVLENVYFQPPESKKMEYPCIRYSKEPPDLKRANDQIYGSINRYTVTVIEYDPEGDISNKVLRRFPMSRIDRIYPADNLYHTVITIYY